MKRKAVFILINLGAALFALCVFFRFSYLVLPFEKVPGYELPVAQFDGYFKFRPGTYKRGDITYKIGPEGFRGEGCNPDIIALGESSTMGLEVDDDHTWPAQLARLRGVSVLNVGLSGATSQNHVALIEREKLSAPVLVYYAGRNDHGLGYNINRYPGPERHAGGFRDFMKLWLILKKAEYRFLQVKLFGHEIHDPFPSVNPWESLYEQNLRNIPATLMVQQLWPFKKETVGLLGKGDYDGAKRTISWSDPRWPEAVRQIDLYRIQERVARERHIPYICTLDGIEPGFFVDTIHLTVEGNAYLAARIHAALESVSAGAGFSSDGSPKPTMEKNDVQ
ncbi:MAG: hypothetical protein WC003_00925 [Terrimicrobiaceae bacterium]